MILHNNLNLQSCNAAVKEAKEGGGMLFPETFRGTVYLGQLSPKAEFLCRLFNPLSYIIEKDAKP